jgi:hypothetical protein
MFCFFSVNQVCSEDGMEFTLRTAEPFIGRIYTYGYYDRCFYRGNGGTANVLRISGAQGYPDCGTQRVNIAQIKTIFITFISCFKLKIYVLLLVWGHNDQHCGGTVQ